MPNPEPFLIIVLRPALHKIIPRYSIHLYNLQAGCDLTGLPRKSLLRLLAEHTSDEGERHALLTLCSRGGRAEYTAQIRDGQPSLLDLLTKYPSCTPPLDALLDALSALPPRMYSIASSPAAEPDQVRL